VIKFFSVTGCILVFITNCERQIQVNENDAKEITIFIDSFYNFLHNDSRQDDPKKWFLNSYIEFYIQDNSLFTTRIVNNNSDDEFFQIISEFCIESGKVASKSIKDIKFVQQVYDVPQGNLFVINYHVSHEHLDTHETFFIKKIEQDYKIYRYFINYNSVASTNSKP
jgi:hypothetical protein